MSHGNGKKRFSVSGEPEIFAEIGCAGILAKLRSEGSKLTDNDVPLTIRMDIILPPATSHRFSQQPREIVTDYLFTKACRTVSDLSHD